MKFTYKINKKKYDVIFCPDKEGYKIRNKKRSYMQITKDLKKINHDGKVLLVIDKNISNLIIKYIIKDLKLSYVNLVVLFVKGNKKNKNLKTLFQILDKLFDYKFSKNSVLISCGGGVVGDVAGLASSLYLRGLNYFHIPTTMTALIDSCIGGKTGINYKGLINSIGNYYHPKKVYISKNIINLLPKREYYAGIPEIIKYGLISNNKILTLLNKQNDFKSKNFSFLSKIIKDSLLTKVKFFTNDVTEKNTRLNLNFGHTFAHAIESSYESLGGKHSELIRHGEAVGLGLLCEIFYINGKDLNFRNVKKLLQKYSLPTDLIKSKIEKQKFKKEIYKYVFLDKKKIGKYPRYIRLNSIGKSQISELKNFERIKKTIQEVLFNNEI